MRGKFRDLLGRADAQDGNVVTLHQWTLDDRAKAIKQSQARLIAAISEVDAARAEYERARQAFIGSVDEMDLGISCTADDFKIEMTERKPT